MGWYNKSVKEVYSKLSSDREGLTNSEVEERLDEYGENRIEDDESTSALKIFIKQFQDKLIYLLIAAAIISLGIGFLPGKEPKYMEPIIIFVILFANGVFGFFQDYKAEKSIESLKEMSSPNAKVIRDGEEKIVSAKDIVPGDIISLSEGDIVPADARVIESELLSLDEAALTGESTTVSKNSDSLSDDVPLAEQKNMVFKGTNVVKGEGKAVVVKTGMETEVGKIAEEIEDTEDKKTPFQEEVDEMGKHISYIVVGLVGIVALAQLFLTGANLITILLMSVGVLVAAIPESLPPIVTFTLAEGSKKMLKKNALVRSLPVVETLGSVNFIVTDKTGTLTKGVMTVKNLYFEGSEYDVDSEENVFVQDGEEVDSSVLRPLLECGVFCNNAEADGDSEEGFKGEPTEVALLDSGSKAGVSKDEVSRERTIPFSSERKRMTVITENSKAYMKGAPEIVLERCDKIRTSDGVVDLTEDKKQEVLDKNEEFASNALRVLGFAEKEVSDKDGDEDVIENDMVFLGLQGMIDPPRQEVKDAVQDCRDAGIDLVMATGDNIETAKAIGKELGFKADKALTGEEIDEMSEEELEEKLKEVDIFARVNPYHKVDILDALEDENYKVAMTGDGVNDAPALKDADVGIAMGQRGTDVAKQSSDMILQDDNFRTIRDAIEEGRAIFDNIRKVTNELLSTNSAEVSFVFFGTLIGGLFFSEFFSGAEATVLTAVMILWVNFASDVPPDMALVKDPKTPGLMDRPPRDKDEPIMDKKILSTIAVTGPLASVIMLPLFFLNIESFALAQTMLFVALGLFEILMINLIRRDYGLEWFDNMYFITAVLGAAMSYLLIVYTPLAEYFEVVALMPIHWLYIFASLLTFALCEMLFFELEWNIWGKRTYKE